MRKLRLLTASKASLGLTGCTHWLNLDAWWDEGGSAKSRIGQDAHTEIELLIEGMQDAKEPIIAGVGPNLYTAIESPSRGGEPDSGSWSSAAKSFLRDYGFLGASIDTEVSFAYGRDDSGAGGVCIGRNRDYSLIAPEDTIAGTVDVQIRESGLLTLLDWKTGDGTRALPQLLTLGGLASGGYEASDLARLLSVEVRKGPGEKPYRVAIDQTTTIGKCREYLQSLHNRIQEAAVNGTRKVKGPHCYQLFCPHMRVCHGVDE